MPPPQRHSAFPSAPQAALLLLAGFLLQYLIDVALYDARRFLGLPYEQLATIGTVLSNGILITVVMHVIGIGHRDLMHPSKASHIATFLLLAPPVLLLLPLVLLLDTVLQSLLQSIFPLSSWERAAFASMVAPTLSAFVATCLIAPVVEEMLFRGILLRAFLARYPRGAAISYSALYFGAAHLNVYQFFLAFFLGLLLGWLYERSRSLIPCIVLHAAVNMSVVLGTARDDSTATQDWLSMTGPAWFAAIVAAAIGALALRRLLAHRKP